MRALGFSSDDHWLYENGFYLTSDASRIPKLLGQWELYKAIVDLPGHVVECGVYKGASLIRWATFRGLLEGQHSRKIIGFDAFGHFPSSDDPVEQEFIESFERNGGPGISVKELDGVLGYKGVQNYELVKGDVTDTIPDYVERHPELRIALLHIDLDTYAPTMVALENLFDRLVVGGLLAFDDYNVLPGETRAADEFLAGKRLVKPPLSHSPAVWRKE